MTPKEKKAFVARMKKGRAAAKKNKKKRGSKKTTRKNMKSVFDAWYKKEEATYDAGVLRSYGLGGEHFEPFAAYAKKRGYTEKQARLFWNDISGFTAARQRK
jgi:DNA invertase Pin-like site-specific DNA recombinase